MKGMSGLQTAGGAGKGGVTPGAVASASPQAAVCLTRGTLLGTCPVLGAEDRACHSAALRGAPPGSARFPRGGPRNSGNSPATKGPFLPKETGPAPGPLLGTCRPLEASCVGIPASGLPTPMTLIPGCARGWPLVTLALGGHPGHGLATACSPCHLWKPPIGTPVPSHL